MTCKSAKEESQLTCKFPCFWMVWGSLHLALICPRGKPTGPYMGFLSWYFSKSSVMLVMAHILTVVAKLKGKWRLLQPSQVASFSSGFSELPQGETRPSCALGDQFRDTAKPGSLCGAPSSRGAWGLTPGACVIPKGDAHLRLSGRESPSHCWLTSQLELPSSLTPKGQIRREHGLVSEEIRQRQKRIHIFSCRY